MTKLDIAISRDEQAKPSSLSVLNSWIDSAVPGACVVLLGAAGIYAANNFPYLDFADSDRGYWFIQLVAFAANMVLALTIWACCKTVERGTRNTRYATVGGVMVISAVLVAAATGVALSVVILPLFTVFTGVDWGNPMPMWILTNILGGAVHASVLMDRSARRQREQNMRVQLETDALGTALDRAELSTLEAQIEPHFLFNTLAHIKRQYCIDTASADDMLGALIEYLDRALPALRRDDWTVGDELELIQVYLEILKQRFGARLEFRITASEPGKCIHLPGLTIATLVENAVRHGVAPKPTGGEILVNAQVDGNELRIDVCDNGVGLQESSGNGLGLMTVRARLRSAFGAKAILQVQPLDSSGVRASIRIPLAGAK
jgi:sensor histidine kinase YesM